MKAGESDLRVMLREMKPTVHSGEYVFVVWPGEQPPPNLPIVMSFREVEGWTLIVKESVAIARGLQCVFRAAWITLEVHSDLNAVGFLAAVTGAMAEAGISCNAVSAVFHDHLFVPAEQHARAMQVLNDLSRKAGIMVESR
jgi:uncharacterized protein